MKPYSNHLNYLLSCVLDDGYSRVMDNSSHAFGGLDHDDASGMKRLPGAEDENDSPCEGDDENRKVFKGRGGSSGSGIGSGGSLGGKSLSNGDDDEEEMCIADVAYALDSDDDEIERDLKAMGEEDQSSVSRINEEKTPHKLIASSGGQQLPQQQKQLPQSPLHVPNLAATTTTTTSTNHNHSNHHNHNNHSPPTDASNQFYSSFFSDEDDDNDDEAHTNAGDTLPSYPLHNLPPSQPTRPTYCYPLPHHNMYLNFPFKSNGCILIDPFYSPLFIIITPFINPHLSPLLM